MPRIKALSCIAFFAVLISAGNVGSQDPFRARSDAESAASALPISAPEYGSTYNPYQQIEPPAVSAPLPITPDQSTVEVAPEPTPQTPPLATPVEPVVQPLKPVAEQVSAPRVPPTIAEEKKAQREPVKPAIAAVPQIHLANPVQPTSVTTQEPPAVAAPNVESADDGQPLFQAAARRLFETVPKGLDSYYDLFMYVSKANRGPFAQRMFVFQRDPNGKIIPYAEWPVSTGREKIEIHKDQKIRTTTPEGIFALDAKRFYKNYWSRTWDGAPMHYAMFYDLQNNGNMTGLAIHAAMGANKVARLGRRDSAGCIRLAPKNAAELFYKIKNTMKGRVPSFAINENGSTDRWGRIALDQTGAPILQDGYRAVLFVENYDGRDEVAGSVVAYTN